MNAREVFDVWAPERSLWSPWVKPVLFAEEQPVPLGAVSLWQTAEQSAQARWTPPDALDAAIVIDLPGPDALALSIHCAGRGWRPVPLFNSCTGPAAFIDNEPLRAGLRAGAERLPRFAILDEARPVFVLDSRRLETRPLPAGFDNRWIVFPQDFPSAARLLASHVRRVILVQSGVRQPRTDLAHVLLRWQQAGLEILAVDLAASGDAQPITVAKPRRFRAFGYRILAALGLRRSSAGGFGAAVPLTGTGGGGMWA